MEKPKNTYVNKKQLMEDVAINTRLIIDTIHNIMHHSHDKIYILVAAILAQCLQWCTVTATSCNNVPIHNHTWKIIGGVWNGTWPELLWTAMQVYTFHWQVWSALYRCICSLLNSGNQWLELLWLYTDCSPRYKWFHWLTYLLLHENDFDSRDL